ncbi:MAG: complex I subunit 5 family protein [Bacillota bacterium]
MNLVICLIVYPLLIAFSLLFIKLYYPKITKLVIVGSSLLLCILSSNLLLEALTDPVVYNLGSWELTLGINLIADPLAAIFIFLISWISLLIIIYSLVYIKKEPTKYYSLLFIMISGLNGMILTGDLFNLFVFLEIVSLTSYALVAFKRTIKAYEASFKYIIIGSLGSFLILLAIILIYQQTGTLNLAQLVIKTQQISSLLKKSILILLLIGFGSKFAAVPLHTWLPDAHPAAPAPISALLSGVVIKAYIYAWLRTLTIFFNFSDLAALNFHIILIYCGVITLFVGHLLAYQQQNLKRLLAYSSISQVGYIMIGLGLLNTSGFIGGLFHIINHAIVKSSLFLAAGVFSLITTKTTIADLKGMGYREPIISLMFTVSALTIIGLPPFNIFISKWLIAQAAIKSDFLIAGGSILIGSILALSYYLKVIKTIYSKKEGTTSLQVNWQLKGPIITLTAVGLIIGIMPGFVLRGLTQAVSYLLNSNLYHQILMTG